MITDTEPHSITGFNHTHLDAVDFYHKFIQPKGFIKLWEKAPYHYTAINIPSKQIFSYVEGDTYTKSFFSEESFLIGLQELKEYWSNMLKDRANPCLHYTGEFLGFLTEHTINLNPPRCSNCKHIKHPTKDPTKWICLTCDI